MMQDGFRKLFLTFSLPLVALAFTGCTAALHVYPVAGPLSAQTPPPVFPARISVNMISRSGSFSTTLTNGESFKGTWKLSAPGPANPAAPDDLSAAWDQVYGAGFYVARVLGDPQCGAATVTGSQGTVLNMQICGPQKSVAKDNKGNVYKLTVDRVG